MIRTFRCAEAERLFRRGAVRRFKATERQALRKLRHHRRHGAALCALFQELPAFWMNLQTRYDLEVAEDEIAAKVARDVQPLEAVTAREA